MSNGMLVLSRLRDEIIEIQPRGGPVILVTINDVRGDKVRIGIQADPSVRIDRFETAQAKRKEGAL